MNARERYERAAHAMQSATAFRITRELEKDFGSELSPRQRDALHRQLKDVRVGLNSAMSSAGALSKLVIDKGVFSEAEYLDYIADFMEAEAELAAQHTRKVCNLPDSVEFA